MKMMRYLMIAILIIVFINKLNYMSTHYNRYGKIINVENEEIIILDTTNNEWVWILNNNDNNIYTRGQNIKLIMNNNNTDETIYDDIIENIELIN
jgi:23S rRNA maturation mini-RNase III